jgi:hypothetical protein
MGVGSDLEGLVAAALEIGPQGVELIVESVRISRVVHHPGRRRQPILP